MKRRRNPSEAVLILADTWDLLEDARERTEKTRADYKLTSDELRDRIMILRQACYHAQNEIKKAAKAVKEGR